MTEVLTEDQGKKLAYMTKNQVRCPKCFRRIMDGFMVGETKCPKCGNIFKVNNLIGLRIVGFNKKTGASEEITLQLG